MTRQYGGEFLDYLSKNNKIGSYCAVDSEYIEWLESKIKSLKNQLKKEKQDKKNNYRKIRYSKTICDAHPEMGNDPPWPYTD